VTPIALCLAWFLADQPPGDIYRFPPYTVLRDGRLFNRRHQHYLEDRLRTGLDSPAGACRVRQALQETRWLYEVWDTAEGAHPGYQCNPDVKACYQRRLRLLLGRDAYWRAELPPPVPVWLFNEMR